MTMIYLASAVDGVAPVLQESTAHFVGLSVEGPVDHLALLDVVLAGEVIPAEVAITEARRYNPAVPVPLLTLLALVPVGRGIRGSGGTD
jgi:hypothetical protein